MKIPTTSQRMRRAALICGTIISSLMVSGCAKYRPHPLPAAPDLAATPDLTAPAAEFALPGLPPHPVSQDGLDETTLVTLAVFNDPDLRAARSQAGVASAQLLQAGLLPDPQLNAGIGASALHYGYALGLSEDIQALLLRGAAKQVAKANQKEVNLNILWQEWQVAEQTRELFLQARANGRIQDALAASHQLLNDNYQRDQAALLKGNATSPMVSADLAVLADSETSLRQQELAASATLHKLNQLLGLQPDAQLRLIGDGAPAPLSRADLDAAVAELPRRRVDLLALQAGYQSQEENVRRSILAQFPSLSAGVQQSRDPVEGINATGASVNLTLPIFNRNRGQIAIQKATREALRQTYQAQLDAATSQANQVWSATQILSGQLRDLDAQLPILEKTAAAAETSFQQGNLDAGLYVSLKSSLLAKQLEAVRLRASLDNAQSVLRALLGLPFNAP